MEAEQIAKAFERQFTSLEKRNHDLMLTIADLAAKNTDLEAQLAARDAEIADYLAALVEIRDEPFFDPEGNSLLAARAIERKPHDH